MPKRFTLLGVILSLLLIGCAPLRHGADCRTPTGCVLAFRNAIRARDTAGVLAQLRQLSAVYPEEEGESDAASDCLVDEFGPQVEWSETDWVDLDESLVEYSLLRFSDIEKCVALETEAEDGVLATTVRVTWPGGASAEVLALSGDGGRLWSCASILFTGVHTDE